MVKLRVSIKATLENCTDLQDSILTVDLKSHVLITSQFRVQCGSCREEHPNWIGIDATESREISGSRGEANFVWRCTMCKREHTISKFPSTFRRSDIRQAGDFDPSFNRSKAFYTLDQSESQKFGTIAVLECRGCEIIKFDPKGIWHCKGVESGTLFDEVELGLDNPDGWNDYDEKASEPVGVSEFESKIERA
ncbi:BQ2448_3919 [Microbotryum intermedium]|uniref:BQ2448_3919 protein n=1 Tax=Microbotryum intermedium TaxID=269621 RepID=A0A238FEY6_9BASI|nr:BQ2448_3919 [Microbotryum intermedium]